VLPSNQYVAELGLGSFLYRPNQYSLLSEFLQKIITYQLAYQDADSYISDIFTIRVVRPSVRVSYASISETEARFTPSVNTAVNTGREYNQSVNTGDVNQSKARYSYVYFLLAEISAIHRTRMMGTVC